MKRFSKSFFIVGCSISFLAACPFLSVCAQAEVDVLPEHKEQILTFVELNCENLFDTRHDTLKNDADFLPDGRYRWTPYRYWKKLNAIGKEIIGCGDTAGGWTMPDLVALVEVENDSVLFDLTRRSLLRSARYEYVMTNSPDERGVDVALLYSPFSFSLLSSSSLRVEPPRGLRPTRDILYASGLTIGGDTLHVFVVHAPSRAQGEGPTRRYRMRVAERIGEAVDSIRAVDGEARIIVAGDFNDYTKNPPLRYLVERGLRSVSDCAQGTNGARGTYRYRGDWSSLDHILVSSPMDEILIDCQIYDAPYLLTPDEQYGGSKPARTFLGPRYLGGTSDHLPLVARFRIGIRR